MKKLIIILILLAFGGSVWSADNVYIVAGGTPGNYQYLVWDKTAGSQNYALASGTTGPLSLFKRMNAAIRMLIIGD